MPTLHSKAAGTPGAPADVYRDFAPFYGLHVGDFADDLPTYPRYARYAHTPLVEIGAGSGRLTILLIRAGHELVAVDISRSMLALLEARLRREPASVRRRLHLVQGDAARLSSGRRTDLVIVPFYTFNCFLSGRALDAALRRFRALLTEGGRLLIDVFIPLGRIAHCPTEPVLKVNALGQHGTRVRGWVTYAMDIQRQLETRRHVFTEESVDGWVRHRRFTIRRRWWYSAQLRDMFHRHGFQIEDVFAGYRGHRERGDAEQLLWVLKRKS
jgi:SAM-dependent methyltransferase